MTLNRRAARVAFVALAASASLRCAQGEVVGTSSPQPTPEGGEPAAPELSYIFESGTQGYSCFRIPAIVKTNAGTLLAFAEGRRNNCSDEDDIDLVLRRSTDGGQSWGEIITVWDEGGNTAGNPAPVVDRNTETVHLLMTWNLGEDDIGEINRGESEDTRRAFLTRSTDDGLSWAEPEEITESVKRPEWGWYATGPVHGIQIRGGEHAGRLVIPGDYIEVGPDREGYSHVIYSDDAGRSWQLGGVAPRPGGNESAVAELSDGRLMLNMRSPEPLRRVATSSDGGQSWSQVEFDHELVEPTCQGSLLAHWLEDGRHILLFSNPASTERENMTIRMSLDDGETWTRSYQVYAGPSAYSDMVMVTDDAVGILYEGGAGRPYDGIVFERIALRDID